MEALEVEDDTSDSEPETSKPYVIEDDVAMRFRRFAGAMNIAIAAAGGAPLAALTATGRALCISAAAAAHATCGGAVKPQALPSPAGLVAQVAGFSE